MGFPHQPETYSGIEVVAILKRRAALTSQTSQLCVDSGTLTYKNVNHRHRHWRRFWLTFLQAFKQLWLWNCISSEELESVKPKATCHVTRQSKHQCIASVRYPIWTVKQASLLARDENCHIKFENRRRDVISLNLLFFVRYLC